MKNQIVSNSMVVLAVAGMLSGCVIRTYPVTKERVDQDLSVGNRGFLKGESSEPIQERKKTRRTQVFEIELVSPLKVEKVSQPEETQMDTFKTPDIVSSSYVEDTSPMGNKGYIQKGIQIEEINSVEQKPSVGFEEYTVREGDTLQKISQHFFGTTKQWMSLYECNKDVLKGPDKIYPGQVIKIPLRENN